MFLIQITYVLTIYFYYLVFSSFIYLLFFYVTVIYLNFCFVYFQSTNNEVLLGPMKLKQKTMSVSYILWKFKINHTHKKRKIKDTKLLKQKKNKQWWCWNMTSAQTTCIIFSGTNLKTLQPFKMMWHGHKLVSKWNFFNLGPKGTWEYK